MNKTCARCQKVVYPIEELKCLDKTWHKTCFKCTECAMALNMKTYKGFNKMPYCEAHIPKAKATAIADTPELKRIAENTKIQSNVKYHEDFEKAKGKFTQVADDPETLRIKQNTKHISNVAYHGDLEKKAAMEKQRGAAEVSDTTKAGLSNLQGTSQYQQPNNSYNQLRSAILQSSHHPTGALIPNDSSMPALSTATPYNNTYDQYDNNSATSTTTGNNYPNNSQRATSQQHQQLYQQQQQQHQAHHNNNHLNSSGSNNNNGGLVVPPPLAYQAPKSSSAATTPSYGGGGGSNASTAQQQLFPNNAYTNSYQSSQATTQGGGIIGGTLNGGGQPQTNHHQHLHHHHNSNGGSAINGSIGKIADYDPLSDGPRPLPNTARSSTTLIYSSDNRANVNNFYAKRIGSIADIDPVNGIYGSLTAQEQQQQQQHHMSNHNMQQPQYYQQMPAVMQQQQQQNHQSQHHNLQQQQLQQQQKQTKQNLRIYRALYDYEAQDVDEVSFREGDIIFEVESIDSGWMTGRVERTGKTGMLPANYVEQAVI
ncbi:LIM and SH3 domain protein Lasp isoform X4 [Musca domestica]|uniref:LIM and SH3 domain protein Lasp isoform X4 n=1 Tax=Musca domestica TaxID=7370 RepID=A0ABM3V3S0_MUSDO|nr:LIM and SH3 domain protein Lasp isoform X4 [Musca domestica]